MTPERWRKIERLYHAARERGTDDRAAFLRQAAEGDAALQAVVESLLARRDEAADFMEPAGVAPRGLPAFDTCDEDPTDGARASWRRRRPSWVWAFMLLATVGSGGLHWVVLTGPQPLGWALVFGEDDASGATRRVLRVLPGSTAERAGLQVHDILAAGEIERFVTRREPYAPHRFEVVRCGERQELTITAARKDLRYWLGPHGSGRLLRTGLSTLCLVLAGLLLFMRPGDLPARWGALLVTQVGFTLLFGALGMTLAPDMSWAVRALPLPVQIISLLWLSIALMLPAGALGFCAVFPRPLPIATRRWWLWLLALAPVASLPANLDWNWLPVYGGPADALSRNLIVGTLALAVLTLVAAMSLLVHNYRRVVGRNERRRLRIVALGFGMTLFTVAVRLVLVTPWSPLQEAAAPYRVGSGWQFVQLSLYAAAPICMSYAILRHRVFDIHVMVRLGLRYAAARGVLLSIVPATAVVLALDVLFHRSQPVSDILVQRGLLYGALGAAALVLHANRRSWLDALDRRFFRERYDANRLLSGVADDVRRSASFEEAARHVIARIDGALHPEWASLLVREPGEPAYGSVAETGVALSALPAGARLIALARVLNKPLENPQSGAGWLQQQLPRPEVKLLREARVEWLFPVSLAGNGREAFLLLGPKRSEEPYSREDRMMLATIAASLGLLLEHAAAPSASSGFTECPECGTCYDPGPLRCGADGRSLVRSAYTRTLGGRYRLDRRLGRGGMGSVYAAFDSYLDRPVALKVIRQEWMTSPDAVARFKREARAVASLVHAHVVTVHDFGVDSDERAYLVMELLEGRTLREELHERGSLEPGRALAILRGVSSAVAAAHERRLLHRDLKPENIFLSRGSTGEVAKVLDFGLVKPLGPAPADNLTGTAPGALIGTIAYMSPEQRAGGPPDESWDVWALTVVAFEMLTGVHPFAVSGEPMTSVVPTSAFFEHALAAERSRRPASVHQLIEQLEAALHAS